MSAEPAVIVAKDTNSADALQIGRQFIRPAWSLCRRECVRFFRQRSRVIGALATPLVFWLLIGSGMGRSFRPPGVEGEVNFLAYALPGILVLTLLFTGIFATISTIEDRREGFLQSVLIAPVPRLAIASGKILGATVLAVIHAAPFIVLAPLVGMPLSIGSAATTLATAGIVGWGLSALGFVLAWRMESTQGFHAVMNLFLMPMWLLSGAMFPLSGASTWVGWLMRLNPLTYGMTAIRGCMAPGQIDAATGMSSWGMSLGIAILFGVCASWIAAVTVAKERSGGTAR